MVFFTPTFFLPHPFTPFRASKGEERYGWGAAKLHGIRENEWEGVVVRISGGGEKGSALVLVMLIIASLLTMGIVSIYSAGDKYKQVTKERLNREALHMADAGISQGAAQLKLDDNDGFNDSELTALYYEEEVTIGSTEYHLHKWIDTTTVDTRKKFKVWLADNDDAGYTSGASNDTISESDSDEDQAVVLVSKGWVEDAGGNVRAYAFVKGLYKRVPYDAEYAVLTSGNIYMNGSISVTGSTPSIHTNGSLTSVGGSDQSQGEVTASGTMTGSVDLTGGGTTGTGGEALVDIPQVSASYYHGLASSFVWDTNANPIVSGSSVRAPAGAPATDCVKITNSSGTYVVTSPTPPAASVCRQVGGNTNSSGVFYFNGPVEVNTSGIWNAVIIATGSITLNTGTIIGGSSDLAGVALVTDGDIVFNGSGTVGSASNQLGTYAGGRVDFGGGGDKRLYGPIITNGTVAANELSGNITIIYDNNSPPRNGPLIGELISWSQIQ